MRSTSVDKADLARRCMRDRFPAAKVVDTHGEMIAYEMPQEAGYKLSEMFAEIQRMGDEGWVQDYAVSQTTLEQVFLQLAEEGAPARNSRNNNNNNNDNDNDNLRTEIVVIN
eukprot:TRINITY_DN12037_c0_g1_i1.p1 TRINITY_DN12037_c0_g1~~TRINITY_DN12037_c0_g1_i1.p1  ORF type:complete len:112 (+),score=34.15 TRINITY_DN12037_c0_g1_i1:177-512(+)